MDHDSIAELHEDYHYVNKGDIVCLSCVASHNRDGVLGSERVCLCTEGFGNRMCTLENVSDRDTPPDIAICMLYIDNALSMRALQEMMSADSEHKSASGAGGHKTLLYGHAVQLKHVQSEMYLACLSSCSSNDKLAFDVGVQETNTGEACWWTIHPASKQRSEGEKVRVGDDVILVSVATERYLHMAHSKGYMVIASFHQTLWNIQSVSSGSVRTRNMGYVFGNDVMRLFHGNDECLTIPENWSEHPQHKYLGVLDNAVQLYHKDKADFDLTAFVMCQNKDPRKQILDEKEDEGMGTATIRYGETNAFIQHVKTQLWMSYQTSEVTKKGLGKVEEKKAVALKDGHMDDCYTFFMALEEESKSARVIRKCSSVLNRFLKGIEALQNEGNQSVDWGRVDLNEVLKLMEDLIEYFSQPADDQDFEEKQNRFRALRSRQDLFQEEGVLNMILDTIDKFSQMEALPDFAGIIGEDTHEITTTVLNSLLLNVLTGILDVLYCVLTESPEALNMINECHIRSVISLLEKVGRDPKVLDVLSSLCEGNGMAVRSSQNLITEYLLPGKDLLLQTAMRDHVSSMMPNVLVGVVEASALFRRWYFEAEEPYLRVGWANSSGFKPFPGSGDRWGCSGVGDDFYSYGFDGRCVYFAGRGRVVSPRLLEKGDVVGCSLDLTVPEIRFSVNGHDVGASYKDFNVDGYFFPVMSLSAKVSCRFIFGGDQGRLRFGPPPGFSATVEAVSGELQITDCLSFGDLPKNVYCGPHTLFTSTEPFVPQPVDISDTILPHLINDIHPRFAENLHELWAMRKIELGWSYGETRSETLRKHPCLTSFDRLPATEKQYNINLALDTLKTIEALGYHLITDEPPTRLRPVRLAQNFQQSNGYRPHPLDTHEITLPDELNPLVEALAKNTHNVWAREKIKRGWTFGFSEFVDSTQKRSPHLVPYEEVDNRIKEANRESAAENLRALQLFGVFIEAPAHEHDEMAEKEMRARRDHTRTYRAEATYAVTGGKWYFEFEILTAGLMRIGWMDVGASPAVQLGYDDRGYAFDGYLGRKWHQGAEDPSGSEMAFDNVLCGDGLVPAMSLGSGQKGRLNFGQQSNSLKFFTTCGLQEGYEPFCVNMYRAMPMWFAKQLARFEDISAGSLLELSRIPATGNSPPCLKLTQKKTETFRDKDAIRRLLTEFKPRNQSVVSQIRAPTIPQEFQDTKERKQPLSALRGVKSSRESDEVTSNRSKQPSYDGDHDSEQLALRGSLNDFSQVDRHNAEEHLKEITDREKPPKKSGGLLSRFRDSSGSRRKDGKGKDEKSARLVGPKTKWRSVDASSVDASDGTPTGQKDILAATDMPSSGPGRQLTEAVVPMEKRGSQAPIDITPDAQHELDIDAMAQHGDKVDEYYYGIRIFPGQDPSQVWVGWVTTQYHFYSSSFERENVERRCVFVEGNQQSNTENVEYRNSYMMNAAELLSHVPDATNTKVSGTLIGCIVDTSVGELSFQAAGQDTGVKFKLEPGAMLFPAAFFTPTTAEILQFELGRIKYTYPISAAMFKSCEKSLISFCPPRLTVQCIEPVYWARVPNESLRTTALKLSDIRGWSVLCDDPVRIMTIYVPEKDESFDILEMIEKPIFLDFHRQTLNLYCKLASHGNQKVAHILCRHVDEDQIMYAVKNLSGPMRQGYHDLLIAIHLQTHASARQSMSKEYVIPLCDQLHNQNVFDPDSENRYPQIMGETYSMLPVMVAEPVRTNFTQEEEMKLLPPAVNFDALKAHVMSAMESATRHAVMNCRDLIGGNNRNHFEPLLKLFDSLLVIGLFDDLELEAILNLIHPTAFSPAYVPASAQKGLTEIELDEHVKIQIVNIIDHLCDIQLRHRIESLIGFTDGFVGELQRDQCKRYMEIKQTDMPPAEAAKKTKEFRCPPKEQMDFCSMLVAKLGNESDYEDEESQNLIKVEEGSWVDALARLVVAVPPPPPSNDKELNMKKGTRNFRDMIVNMLREWALGDFIESNELIRKMFNLLLRQYSGVRELQDAMAQTYVLHERNNEDVQDFIVYLIQIRELLTVQFEHIEEAILKRGLWKLMNNRIFFQHPDLMRLLSVHENVMTIMMNILTAQQGAVEHEGEEVKEKIPVKDSSEMVVACSRFLCYFCRTSRQNQKAMFEHLSFLLDNATMLLARPSLRGSVPLDVAYSSFMDNNELALALKEEELDKVTVYLSRCGLQPNSEMISKGYPDIGWDPVEGERYIDFLRFCVWINGENVEENANLVIRLLIRRPECLGIALKGEGQGLFAAFKEAIALSEDIRTLEEDITGSPSLRSGLLGETPSYPSKETESEDYLDLGAATLDFYSSLVDLLAKCAPDHIAIQAGKGDSLRARAILRSLISLDDLGQILSLRFTIPNLTLATTDDNGPLPGLLPNHKGSVLLFLDRVYGIDSQDMLFHFLEQSFLPDLRAATMMDSPRALESDTALALNRYLCNAVLPLLTNHSHFFADAEHHTALLDATVHTVYRMNRLKSLTKNQREAVSDFLVAITRELPPGMMIKLLRKVIADVQQMSDMNVLVPLRLMTLHYERCGKYYGTGNQYGVATEVEKRLSMLLFYAIFDSLGSRPYDPDLFGKALPCMTAIGSAISPDYTLTTSGEDAPKLKEKLDDGAWVPKQVEVSYSDLPKDLQTMTEKFAEHFHDSWASRKLEKGWVYGDLYSRQNCTHPRLKPFSLLRDFEKNFYKERCAECLRALIDWGYTFELRDPDVAERAVNAHTPSGTSVQNFSPKPVDLTSMTLEKDMVAAGEKMAEWSHLIWASKVWNDLNTKGGFMPTSLVPWDLLTDFERRKDRFRANEILKFLQYHGYHVESPKIESNLERGKNEGERSSVEKRFAYNLLEKLIQYLEQASLKMKSVKPSQELTRRNTFRKEGQDVKFFEKVVLPLMHAYFNAHKNYFLEGSSMVQTGTASNKEKEMVANLFCRLAALLRIKNRAFGSVAKITVKCLQGLTQALDLRTLVKTNSDIVRTSLLTFFNNCADDLFVAVNELKDNGQYSLLRGQNLKSWISLEFAHQMIVPVLTSMFTHLARNHFGTDLLLDDIQAACYKILNSLYMVTGLSATAAQRKSIGYETEKHRPGLGQCLSAFASCFPVAFLESEYNKNNKYSVLAKTQDQSVQVQEMLQNLNTHIPHIEKLLTDIETVSTTGVMYNDNPNIYDVDLPLMCSYLAYWFNQGPDGRKSEKLEEHRHSLPMTAVSAEHINRIFCALLRMLRNHIVFAVQIIQNVTCDPVKDHILPIAERLRRMSEKAFREEEHMRTHPDDADEGTVAEDNARLVRDTYAYFPILMKYTDLHRAQWLKTPSWETDGVYENVAVIFRIWSQSQHFKREELNYMAQFEEDAAMFGGGEMKTGKAAIAERKKKRREGQVKKDKHASSIVIACLKRLLPVGLNLDIVQQSKERFLQKEPEEKVREFIKGLLDVQVKTDPTDKNAWQLSLYRKIGKSQMRGKNEMTQDAVIEKIFNMGQVSAILHTTEHPQQQLTQAWKKIVSTQRKRAMTSRLEREDKWKRVLTLQRKRMAISLITASHLYRVDRHRGINFFLPAFSRLWLEEEDVGQDKLITDLVSGVVTEDNTRVEVVLEDGVPVQEESRESDSHPDPLKQLIRCFQRAATSEQSLATPIHDDNLYIRFADVMSKSIHIEEEDGDDGDDEVDQAQKEEQSQALRAEQGVLADRGAAIMCLMYLSASNGEPNDMVARTLELGIHLLSGGNVEIQRMLIEYLQLKKDVRFFTSMAGLMNKCSVLNLEMFERQIKAEGLGMGADLAAGANQNLNDAEFTCSLFRFLQLTCEGHNLDFQNYLRTQPGHTTSVNLINCTVDYLLRLQESVMDFYWHYSSKEVIDEGGKEYFLRAIQGPCVGNQMTLANSRLWDAINGFFFLFAHMMEKLYRNSTQLELLREFLNLQKDMIVLMLSMLEGNVLNGPIGKQMVDALVESQPSVEKIIKFSDMFLKLKDLTTSQAFLDFDTNRDGWISPKEFQRAMESQKMYTVEDITYLMMCTDVNNDGKVDYMEFTERFHNPARDIGFNLAVLLTNLKEHITNDPRLEKIIEKAHTLLEYFDPFLGRIEIMGSSKRVEKIYFEIQESWLEQWGKQQIRDSKNSFLFNVLQDDGGDQGKLEAFINFCEQSSAGEQLSQTFKSGYIYGLTAASALRPENVKQTFKDVSAKVRQMTWIQLFCAIGLLLFHCLKKLGYTVYLILMTLFRFVYYLTTPGKDEDEAKTPLKETHFQHYGLPILPEFHHTHIGVEAFGFAAEQLPTEHHLYQDIPTFITEEVKSEQPTPQKPPSNDSPSPPSVHKAPSMYESVGAPAPMVASPSEMDLHVGSYEPKIAEQNISRSKGSILNMLARNFKTIEKTTLYLAFFINVILLFHRVDIKRTEPVEDAHEDDEEKTAESIYISGMMLPYIEYELTGWVLAQVLYWISVLHLSTSFALLVSFYQLKIPLITFKREKEVARRLMFDGCWITEEDNEESGVIDTLLWYLDRIVISSKSFPMMYWDKFVRRKTRQKFKDQVDEETLTAILGEEKSSSDNSFDYRYTCWLWIGVILTNGQFLYRVGYLLCSACGVFISPFFYAFHLIDVVLSFPMLKAILQSLILTIMMTLVVVYLYTVIAFNFFRKFYVQEGEDGEEPDRKCHNMATCFIYHFYVGVRAGGGIGDELESPYGDELEYPRMFYDISFFFFVIIILLAIMQGLIIDAFGELRDQQESATEKLESSCFICDIGKETFDRMPRGFEIHTTKEHNFANYLFFLQHLVNKDNTEYTGQETYVREKDWDFFPVGECFVKQYEDQLLQS
uniref:Ryanodine receptor 44F n=1 Tax=Angiostrongylus cantonensis TaxID=6313 RepID=A0A158P902_ANGCA